MALWVVAILCCMRGVPGRASHLNWKGLIQILWFFDLASDVFSLNIIYAHCHRFGTTRNVWIGSDGRVINWYKVEGWRWVELLEMSSPEAADFCFNNAKSNIRVNCFYIFSFYVMTNIMHLQHEGQPVNAVCLVFFDAWWCKHCYDVVVCLSYILFYERGHLRIE
jgi:hypothetical protein